MSGQKFAIVFVVLAVLSGTRALSDTPNSYGVYADWDGLAGHYLGRTAGNKQGCEAEISVTDAPFSGRQLIISLTSEDGEHMSFAAPVIRYKRSLQQGNHAAGTAAYAEKVQGITFGRHITTYGMLHFSEPDGMTGPWPLRGIRLSWVEADFYLVVAEQQLDCWSLVKTGE